MHHHVPENTVLCARGTDMFRQVNYNIYLQPIYEPKNGKQYRTNAAGLVVGFDCHVGGGGGGGGGFTSVEIMPL